MGQRSQCYVRYNTKENDEQLVARYFQWNYGTRMVSRARHTMEWLQEHKEYLDFEVNKIHRIMEVNFDMCDVVLSVDILKEYEEYGEGMSFGEYVFEGQDNNDGQLYIDVTDDDIKYCLTYPSEWQPLTAKEYMEHEEWYSGELKDADLKECHEENLKWITDNAKIMTKQELDEFVFGVPF